MRAVFGTVALLAIPCCMFCQAAAKPIPPEWLRDGRVVVQDLNFLIASPNPEWHWSYQQFTDPDKETAFIAEVAPDTKYVLMVMDRGGKFEGTKKFADGMQRSLPKGWQIKDVQLEATDVPTTGASKLKIKIQLPDESTLYAYAHVVSGKKTYMLMAYSPETTEPLQFTRFVRSFALISPDANAEANPANLSGIFIIWAIWGAIVDSGYKRRGGVRPTRNDKIGLLSAIGLSVVTMVALGLYGASGEALGHLTALFLALIFPLWEFARWRIRRKNPIVKNPVAATAVE